MLTRPSTDPLPRLSSDILDEGAFPAGRGRGVPYTATDVSEHCEHVRWTCDLPRGPFPCWVTKTNRGGSCHHP